MLVVKNLPVNAGRCKETWARSLSGDDALKEGTAVFLPGESHGQRSLVGYSPARSGVSKCGALLKRLSMHTHKIPEDLIPGIQE